MAIIQAMAGTTVSNNGPIPDPPNNLNPDAPTQNTGSWLAAPSNLTTAPRGNVVVGTGGLTTILGNIQPGLSRSKYVGNWGNSPYAPLVSTWFGRKTPIRTGLPDTYLEFDQNLGSENNYVLMWGGYFRAPNTAVYNFYLRTDDDGYFYLGNTAIAGWNATNAVVDSHPGPSVSTNSVFLEQDKYYPVRMLFAEYSGAEKLQLHWNSNATPFTSGVAGNVQVGGESLWSYNADITTGYSARYTARQWLDGYSGGSGNSALYILLADYPDASIIPVGAKAKVSGNAHVVVGSLTIEAYGQPCWLIQFNNPNENIIKGTYISFSW